MPVCHDHHSSVLSVWIKVGNRHRIAGPDAAFGVNGCRELGGNPFHYLRAERAEFLFGFFNKRRPVVLVQHQLAKRENA